MRKKKNRPAKKTTKSLAPVTNGPSPFVIMEEQPPTPHVANAALAEQIVGGAMCEYLHLSSGGTVQVPASDFARIRNSFERSIIIAQSDEEKCQTLEARIIWKLESDIPDSQLRHNSVEKMTFVWEMCWQAMESASAGTLHKLERLLKELRAELQEEELKCRQPKAQMSWPVGLIDRYSNKFLECGPEIAGPFQEYLLLLHTAEGRASAKYLDEMNAVARIRHSAAMIRLLYAQVLAQQGGLENRHLAQQHLRESIRDSLATELLVDALARPPAYVSATN